MLLYKSALHMQPDISIWQSGDFAGQASAGARSAVQIRHMYMHILKCAETEMLSCGACLVLTRLCLAYMALYIQLYIYTSCATGSTCMSSILELHRRCPVANLATPCVSVYHPPKPQMLLHFHTGLACMKEPLAKPARAEPDCPARRPQGGTILGHCVVPPFMLAVLGRGGQSKRLVLGQPDSNSRVP